MMSELLDSLLDKETGLNEREKYFLEVLFDEAGGDVPTAMKLAGYPKDVSPNSVRRKLSKEIKSATKDFMVASTAKASVDLLNVLNDPAAKGTSNRIKAIKEILDRGDVNRTETIMELPENAIILLPPKKETSLLELRKDEYKEIESD